MTVEELIKELDEYPKDTEVVEYAHGNSILYVLYIHTDTDVKKIQLIC